MAGGPYAIVASGATGSGLSNYTITYDNAPTGLTVTPAALTLTASDQSKLINTTLTFNGTEYTASGLHNGETVGTVGLTSSGAVSTAGNGNYAINITPNLYSGGTFNGANYNVTLVAGNLDVTGTLPSPPPPPPPQSQSQPTSTTPALPARSTLEQIFPVNSLASAGSSNQGTSGTDSGSGSGSQSGTSSNTQSRSFGCGSGNADDGSVPAWACR